MVLHQHYSAVALTKLEKGLQFVIFMLILVVVVNSILSMCLRLCTHSNHFNSGMLRVCFKKISIPDIFSVWRQDINVLTPKADKGNPWPQVAEMDERAQAH